LREAYCIWLNATAEPNTLVRVRLPLEVKRICGEKIAAHRPALAPHAVINIEEADFLEKQVLRKALHEREGGRCFAQIRGLHVIEPT